MIDRLILWLVKPSVTKSARKNLPVIDGTLQLNGLKDAVKIYRDKWGIPHIYANNLNDLAFAQAYVHAQDRLWQMDLMRRVARGQLSEVIGKDGLDTDRATRTLGFERLAQKDIEDVDPILKGYLDSYVAGVNAAIETMGPDLPPEFKLLKYKPNKWEVIDVMSFSRMLAFQMSFAWYGSILRARLIDKVGVEQAKELEIEYPRGNPNGLDNVAEVNRITDDGILEALSGPLLKPIKGSNAWSISGSRTKNGSPILCNDPHLPLNQPAIWYENHLASPGMEVTGVSLPGVPLVMIGHNRHISWGMTLAFTDIQDVYIEQFTTGRMTHYMYQEKEHEAIVVNEVIKVKGEKDHTERVVLTHNGPVISSVVGETNKKITLRAKTLEKSGMIQGWFQLNHARNWNDFVNAMKHINAPALNVPYADTEGNIGYWVTGEVPIRKGNNGLLPSKGWTGEDDWVGNVPFEEMPHTFNPEKGYVVTCNHKIISDDYPHYLGNAWMNGYRAKRLEEIFSKKDKFDMNDMQKMQRDTTCLPALELIAHFKGLRLDDLNVELMKQQLLSWDGNLSTDSIAASIYQATRHSMIELVIGSKIGEELITLFKGGGYNHSLAPQTEFYGHDTSTLLRMLNNPDSWWIKEAGGKEKVMADSLAAAYDYLKGRLGEDMDQWQWGNLHQVTFHHPIGAKKPFNKLFNQGPFPIPGDTDTLFQTACLAHDPLGDSITAPSYRQIIDMGNFSNSLSVMPAGQSGNILSDNYTDQAEMWLEGKYHPMYWTREEVELNKKHLLELIPKAAVSNPDLTIN